MLHINLSSVCIFGRVVAVANVKFLCILWLVADSQSKYTFNLVQDTRDFLASHARYKSAIKYTHFMLFFGNAFF